MHEPMRSPCARLVLLMHSLERADNWRSIIGNYTQQRSGAARRAPGSCC